MKKKILLWSTKTSIMQVHYILLDSKQTYDTLICFVIQNSMIIFVVIIIMFWPLYSVPKLKCLSYSVTFLEFETETLYSIHKDRTSLLWFPCLNDISFWLIQSVFLHFFYWIRLYDFSVLPDQEIKYTTTRKPYMF